MECKLTKAVQRSLLVDTRWRAKKAVEEIGTCLELAMGNPDLKGTYVVLKSWYRHAYKKRPTPSWADMTKVTWDCAALTSGKNQPYHVGM